MRRSSYCTVLTIMASMRASASIGSVRGDPRRSTEEASLLMAQP
jgi:hypothetical protein